MRKTTLTLTACLLFSIAAQATPVLLTDNAGQWIGADRVDIFGIEYDFRFVDGTCGQAFGACDQEHFAFKDSDSALEATFAISHLYFVNGYVYQPEKIFGCSNPDQLYRWCSVVTPFDIVASLQWGDYSDGWRYMFYPPIYDEGRGGITGDYDVGGYALNDDFTQNDAAVWAVWTSSSVSRAPSVSAPELPSVLLISVALVGFIVRRRTQDE